jgi:hypothetical protein
MRVAAPPDILQTIHDHLFTEFQITTSDTGRFLGMDVDYDNNGGVLKMHMATYIDSTVQRFTDFDGLFSGAAGPIRSLFLLRHALGED